MTNEVRAVKDQDEFVCCLCGDPVPAPQDLQDRVEAIEHGILCEPCYDFPMSTTRSFFEKQKPEVVRI